jgi:hypothetical protein
MRRGEYVKKPDIDLHRIDAANASMMNANVKAAPRR